MELLDFKPGLSEADNKLIFMQSSIDDAIESMGKVRRKVFVEITSVRKKLTELETENAYLRQALQEASNVRATQYPYEQESDFFNVFQLKEA